MSTLYKKSIVAAMVRELSSTGFVIVTEHKRETHSNETFTDYQYHFRDEQPCFGGEQRKYSCTHGDLCSRPESSKPKDLYATFPDGTPYAMGYRLADPGEESEDFDLFMTTLYSQASPWSKGFWGPSNPYYWDDSSAVSFVKSDERIIGVVLSSTSVDPTVMVNSGQFAKTVACHGGHGFKELIDLGLTPNEALGVMMLNNGQSPLVSGHVCDTSSYYFPVNFSAKRFFEQKPHDFSGGTFKDGFDYNRKKVQDIFSAKDGEGMVWGDWMHSKGFHYNVNSSTEDKAKFIAAVKEFFAEGLAKDVELTIVDPKVPEAFYIAKGLKKPEVKAA